MKQRPFEILYEDQEILVLDKKAGMLCIPDRYHSGELNLFALLSNYRGKIYPLHRLDKETSGVMIYAKTEKSHQLLSKQFENRSIEKTYLAIVNGILNPLEDTIQTFLAPSPHYKDKIEVTLSGKLAITKYKVVETFSNFSVLEVYIETGRQHQIRVHLAHIGHPLVVDKKYGLRSEIFASDIKKKKFIHKTGKIPLPLIKRHSLHAKNIRLKHPLSQKDLAFEAPLPKDIKALINQIRKWD